ncbi:uncharacterized protein [Antedon mediterranea]|uniref:uncharacterized protein n=1 Tax=Antedon mediterranea TaxID=105859 RepID=UPI003AF78B15
MKLKYGWYWYLITLNGIAKIFEVIFLINGFCLSFYKIIECNVNAPPQLCISMLWGYYLFAVFAMLLAVSIMVIVLGHLIMPDDITDGSQSMEIRFCIAVAFPLLVASIACVASNRKEANYLFKPYGFQVNENIQAVTGGFGFATLVCLILECSCLKRAL